MTTPRRTDVTVGETLGLAARLRRSATRLARVLREEADLELSPSQFTTLSTLAREGPVTLGQLADKIRVTPSTVTRIADHLEERGLLARAIDSRDRRRSVATLTPAGIALLIDGRARRDAVLQERIDRLSTDELGRLNAAVDVLERLAE